MLLLLPPSETKRSGGRPGPAVSEAWSFPSLQPVRDRVVAALIALSADPTRAAKVLSLSPRQLGEIDVNAALVAPQVMPAIDRYTGVLFDALSASTLDATARRWLRAHVAVQAAPFGLVGALDEIPSYRLGAGVSLPGLHALKREWAAAVTDAMREAAPAYVLDLRSEAYRALGPVPAEIPSVYVRVVSAGEGGAVRALNHFNKHAKGALVRELAQARPRVRSIPGLLTHLRHEGHRVEEKDGEWLFFERSAES